MKRLLQSKELGKSERKESVEILRCFLMFLIVCTHAFHHGPWGRDGRFWTLFFIVIRWHVPAFIAISGWFGIRFSLKKFLRIWCLLAFYGVLSFSWRLWMKGECCLSDFTSCGGWFAHSYLMLMLFSGFLNAGAEKLAELGSRRAWSIWGLACLGLTLTWSPKHLFTYVSAPEFTQCSFLLLLVVYVSARLMRLTGLGVKIGRFRLCVLCWLILVASVIVYGLALKVLTGCTEWQFGLTWSFASPAVWITGLVIVTWAVQRKGSYGFLGKVCTWMAPSMFAVYLIHETTSFGRMTYLPIERMFVECESIHPFFAVLAASAVAFISCAMLDIVRRFFLNLFQFIIRRIK